MLTQYFNILTCYLQLGFICYSYNMENLIKYTWITVAIMGSIAMVANLPFDVWGNAYRSEVSRIQLIPLRRIDATNRYIEAIENGQEDISKGIKPRPPKKYYREIPREQIKRIGRLYIYDYDQQDSEEYTKEVRKVKKYQKPLYKRDKNNPNILHRVY